MKRQAERVPRSSPWIAAAALAAATVAFAAAGRIEGPSPATTGDDAHPTAIGRTASSVAENTTTSVTMVETTEARESLPTTADSSSFAAGVRAFVDPETGRLTSTPTRAQLQSQVLMQRSSALARSTSGLQPFALSRGGRGLNLQGRFQTAMRVERGADGSFHVTCGDGHEDGHSHDHSHDSSRSTTAAPVQ